MSLKFASFIGLTGAQASSEADRPFLVEAEFMQFIAKHGKSYGTKEEYDFRLGVFSKTLEEIQRINSVQSSSTHETNKFSDRTEGEIRKMLGYRARPAIAEHLPHIRTSDVVPEPIDWRDHGAVSAVRDDRGCGSAWAASVTGAIEGAEVVAKRNKQAVALSEQQLLECDDEEHGCAGGLMSEALAWAVNNPLSTDRSYPFNPLIGNCRSDITPITNVEAVYRVGRAAFEVADITDFKDAITKVPQSILIAGGSPYLVSYTTGIMDNQFLCTKEMNHAVTVVGWGHDKASDTDYILIKNSWGTDWGEGGFGKVELSEANVCGILFDINYAVSKKSN